MAGLLANIQSYFDKTHSGKYIACLLAQLFEDNKDDFAKIVRSAGIPYEPAKDHAIVSNGWRLTGIRTIRYADVAVLNSVGEPLILIEVKDADINHEGNADQFVDYVDCLAAERQAHFLFLSRTSPPHHLEKRLREAVFTRRVHQLRFGQLYGPLRDGGTFARMLTRYLEDIHVVYYDKRPTPKALEDVARQTLGLGGRKATETSIPEFFEVVFGNLLSLGQWVQNNNAGLFKQGFKRRVYIEPWYDLKLAAEHLGKNGKPSAGTKLRKTSTAYLGDYATGGEVLVYTCAYISHKLTRVYLEFGYWLELFEAKEHKFRHGIYAVAEWKPWKDAQSHRRDRSFKHFPSEQEFEHGLRDYFAGTKAEIERRKDVPVDVKRLIGKLKVP